jgi:hypothetical protein
MRGRSVAAIVLVGAMGAGCGVQVSLPTPDDGCPRSVAEAAATEHGRDVIVATGHVVRFVPSPQAQFRGYDVNLQSRNGEPYFNTVLVRVRDRLPGIVDGQPVLVVAERTDRASALVAGDCPVLVPIPESDVDGF